MSVPANRMFDQWNDYRATVLPPRADMKKLRETRRAFYAGAWAAMQLLMAVGQTQVSEFEGAAYLEKLLQELDAFKRRVGVDY
jgi:hypothetical protein